jgi:hypothetical protein
MSAYKQFLASDIVVTPFKVNKSFNFTGSTSLIDSNVGIDRFLGKNIQADPFVSSSAPTTGYISTQYQELVYNSVKQLYYSNHLSSSFGDTLQTASIFPGSVPSGNVLVGSNQSVGRFYDYSPTTLTYYKYFPTASNTPIAVLSIPGRLFGEYVLPNSFFWKANTESVTDDGNGNLILSSSGKICGNIFYEHGIAVLLDNTEATGVGGIYGTSTYGSSSYTSGDIAFMTDFVNATNVTCSFSSSLTIYETQYKCTLRENEFNFTLNPSISSGSTATTSSIGTFYTPGQYLESFATASYFNPYVTMVGLYNDNQELLAIAKLSQPLPVSPTTDTTILINIDR